MARDASGGLKGAIQRTGKFFFSTGMYARDTGFVLLKYGYSVGGKVAFSIATTSMIVLMPLLFEIAREGQVRCLIYALDYFEMKPPTQLGTHATYSFYTIYFIFSR
jgi:hypothetical protein